MNLLAKAYCDGCGGPIYDLRHAWRKIEGYERPRDQGGTNHVALRTSLGKFKCSLCMTKAQSGLAPGQEALM